MSEKMDRYKKNDMCEVTIEDQSTDGSGIGKINGYTLFVKDAVIGDEVLVKIMKAKKNYAFARLMEIRKPSPCRVEAKCPCAKACGGCQLQSLSYEKQLEFKHRMVKGNLARIGGFPDVEVLPVIGMEEPFRYRNKAQFPIGTDKDGNPIAGFYAGRTHSIIPCSDCILGHEVNRRVLNIVLTHMRKNRIPAYDETTGAGLVRHVLIRRAAATGEIMVCLVLNGDTYPDADYLVETLRQIEGMTSISININTENTNVILGTEMLYLWGPEYITDRIGDVSYRISPLSFYQVNPQQTKILYDTALEYAGLGGDETVWDLYCGIGTISLFLAKAAGKVYGVEIIPQAIENARENAQLNGIGNAEFFVGRSEEVFPEYISTHEEYADVVVVDPPRKGCDPQLLDAICAMGPGKVVYVSCDPATLARDLQILCAGGYRIEKVQPVDMFPQTVHVETCVLLTKTV